MHDQCFQCPGVGIGIQPILMLKVRLVAGHHRPAYANDQINVAVAIVQSPDDFLLVSDDRFQCVELMWPDTLGQAAFEIQHIAEQPIQFVFTGQSLGLLQRRIGLEVEFLVEEDLGVAQALACFDTLRIPCVIAAQGAQDQLTQVVLGRMQLPHKGLTRKLLPDRRFVVLLLAFDRVKEPLIVITAPVQPAVELEVALFALGE